MKSGRLARALGSEDSSLLESGASDLDESERVGDFGFIIFCIIIGIILLVVTLIATRLGFYGLKSCKENPSYNMLSCFGFLFGMVVGGLCVWGGFALALPVGITVLVIAVLYGIYHFPSLLEIQKHDFHKPLPNWKAIHHLAM